MPPSSPALFRTDFFVPRYRSARYGEWELTVTQMCLSPGYWSGPMLVPGMAFLARGDACWMSITPFELESQEFGIRAARGHVLIGGLGMGWAAAAVACQPAVRAVTVVETDREVFALHRELDIFAQLPPAARAKLRLVEANAFSYVPDRPVDLLMPDIWLPLVSDGRLDEVSRMQANVGADAIYFWSQEMEIARHAIAAGRTLDEAGIAATIAETGLPLIGPDYPGYTDKLIAAARRWMRGRWLPGSSPPW